MSRTLQGLSLLDRRLFLETASTLAMACQRMVRLGVPAHETKPYMDQLERLKERLQAKGPLLPTHLLDANKHAYCGVADRVIIQDGHGGTIRPEDCDCLECLRVAARHPVFPTTGADLVN